MGQSSQKVKSKSYKHTGETRGSREHTLTDRSNFTSQQRNREGEQMTRVDREEDVDNDVESVPLYEVYWAQNTTAHGLSRIANTSKFQRFIWIVALLVCFGVVIWEIQKSALNYLKYDTTTEIIKSNELEIEFPSVTFCNFNRWRKSKLTDEKLAQLTSILSMYSYDYVINDIDEAEGDAEALLNEILQTTTTPAAPPPTTPPPIYCPLPNVPSRLEYRILGTEQPNATKVLEGTSIEYRCTESGKLPMDGDIIMNCTKDSTFAGRLPICTDVGDVGDRYTVKNSLSDPNAMVVSERLRFPEPTVNHMAICFWVYMLRNQTLGTILSYGEGDESLLSIIQTPQRQSPEIYGLKYKLFGTEGRAITLTTFGQWNPFCVQYSLTESTSQLYKFLVFGSENGFELYGDNPITRADNIRPLPAQGRVVLFNDYSNYLLMKEGMDMTMPSSGGSIANVNVWSRNIPPEVMDAMLWEGDMLSMTQFTFSLQFGDVFSKIYTYNVSEVSEVSNGKGTRESPPSFRKRRQVETENVTVQTSNTTFDNTSLNSTEFNQSSATISLNATASPIGPTNEGDDALQNVFNYAEFTRDAGWQLVDAHSNHSEGEPRTLLQCKYRGEPCDSRWFEHKFGAYGNCYTFNQNISKELSDAEGFRLPLIQDNPGPTGGLNLMLDIQTWEYAETDTLDGNPELGLKFIVHAPYEVPVINSMGYAAGPGSKAYVGFEKTSLSNIEPPWGKCNKTKRLEHFSQYTLGGCALECKLHRVLHQCQCKPYYYPGEFDVCSFDKLRTCAFVEIGKTNECIIRNIRDPWGKCDPDKTLKHSDTYTLSWCTLECKLNATIAACGCKPYYFPGDFPICGFTELRDCAFVEIAKINANFSQCGCPIACQAEEFNVKLSYVNFPNDQYGRDLGYKLNITLPEALPGIPGYSSRLQYIRSNLVSIDLYFESMSVTEMNQNKAMDGTALLSNIGGQLGLFIGCSFLTFFELLECIFMSTLYHYKRIRFQRQQKKKEYHPNGIPETSTARNESSQRGFHDNIELDNNYYSAFSTNNNERYNGFPPPPV